MGLGRGELLALIRGESGVKVRHGILWRLLQHRCELALRLRFAIQKPEHRAQVPARRDQGRIDGERLPVEFRGLREFAALGVAIRFLQKSVRPFGLEGWDEQEQDGETPRETPPHSYSVSVVPRPFQAARIRLR